MGVFDFIKTKQAPKASNVSVNSPRPNANLEEQLRLINLPLMFVITA